MEIRSETSPGEASLDPQDGATKMGGTEEIEGVVGRVGM